LARDVGDPFAFEITQTRDLGAAEGMNVTVDVRIAGLRFGAIPIDLAVGLNPYGQVDRVRPTAVVDVDVIMPAISGLPEFVLYPLPGQIADKVSAMYERHQGGQYPSSRYRDLTDLLLIATTWPLDARRVSQALTSEAKRRGLELPVPLHSPGPAWVDGYSRVARTTTLAGALHSLAPALDLANRCIAPLLTGAVTIGSWDPHSWVWRSPGDINQGVVEPQG
jgi:hypothetical protein